MKSVRDPGDLGRAEPDVDLDPGDAAIAPDLAEPEEDPYRAELERDERLDSLASFIRDTHSRAMEHERGSWQAHLELGRLLLQAREEFRSDKNFGIWFKSQGFGFSPAWARQLRYVATHADDVERLLATAVAGSAIGVNAVVAVLRAKRKGIDTTKGNTPTESAATLGVIPAEAVAAVAWDDSQPDAASRKTRIDGDQVIMFTFAGDTYRFKAADAPTRQKLARQEAKDPSSAYVNDLAKIALVAEADAIRECIRRIVRIAPRDFAWLVGPKDRDQKWRPDSTDLRQWHDEVDTLIFGAPLISRAQNSKVVLFPPTGSGPKPH